MDEAKDRLRQAGLIPPVRSLEWQGDLEAFDEDQPWVNETEWVLVKVAGAVSPELEAKLSKVLHGLRYEVRSVPPLDGLIYLSTE